MKERRSETVVIHYSARFTSYASGLIRLEYSKSGDFKDQGTVRIPRRPVEKAFSLVHVAEKKVVIKTNDVIVEYFEDGNEFNEMNLLISDIETGERIWVPGQVDNENLGGVPLSMDNISRQIVPEGVHAAETKYHCTDSRYQLWTYKTLCGDECSSKIHVPCEEEIGLEQYLSAINIEDTPDKYKELINERRKYPPGLLSRNGYFLFNDSDTETLSEDDWFVENNAGCNLDYYFFYYKNDFRKGLEYLVSLFGKSPLIPKYALGLCYTKYPMPCEEELKDIIRRFEVEGLPIDMIALDLPWHKYDWFGFDWNKECINPDTYFPFCRENGIHNLVNIHPSTLPIQDSGFDKFVSEASIMLSPNDIKPPFDKCPSATFTKYDISEQRCARAYWNVFLEPLFEDGADGFWYDGNGGGMAKKESPQFLTNYIFDKLFREKHPDKRPMMMSRFAGFGSHRFPLHFSADTFSQWEVLRSQVEFTLRAGHMGFSYITHDIAGIQNYQFPFIYQDSELYARWVQWGSLSPVFRLHSAHEGVRLPWEYGDKMLEFFKRSLKLRQELLPYLYTLVYITGITGMPMLRSCALSIPEWEEGYDIWDSFFLGENLFVTPFLSPGGYRKVILPKGSWYFPLTRERFDSDGKSYIKIVSVEPSSVPHFVRNGSVLIKRVDDGSSSMSVNRYVIEVFLTDLYEDEIDFDTDLYEDDGISMVDSDEKFRLMKINVSQKVGRIIVSKKTIKGTDMNMLSEKDGVLRIFTSYKSRFRLAQPGNVCDMSYDEHLLCYTVSISEFFGKGDKSIVINYFKEEIS